MGNSKELIIRVWYVAIKNNFSNMSKKNCDSFSEFFIYRLESILTKGLRKQSNKTFVSSLVRKQENKIIDEFNFFLNTKLKSLAPPTRKSKIMSVLLESWRPVMMYVFMYIIAQYYILNPIAEFFWPALKLKDLPPEMWTLLTVAVGGYITSRGVEKGLKIWRGGDNMGAPNYIPEDYSNSNTSNSNTEYSSEYIDEDVEEIKGDSEDLS